MTTQHILLVSSAIVDAFKHLTLMTSWNEKLTGWCLENGCIYSNHPGMLLGNL